MRGRRRAEPRTRADEPPRLVRGRRPIRRPLFDPLTPRAGRRERRRLRRDGAGRARSAGGAPVWVDGVGWSQDAPVAREPRLGRGGRGRARGRDGVRAGRTSSPRGRRPRRGRRHVRVQAAPAPRRARARGARRRSRQPIAAARSARATCTRRTAWRGRWRASSSSAPARAASASRSPGAASRARPRVAVAEAVIDDRDAPTSCTSSSPTWIRDRLLPRRARAAARTYRTGQRVGAVRGRADRRLGLHGTGSAGQDRPGGTVGVHGRRPGCGRRPSSRSVSVTLGTRVAAKGRGPRVRRVRRSRRQLARAVRVRRSTRDRRVGSRSSARA